MPAYNFCRIIAAFVLFGVVYSFSHSKSNPSSDTFSSIRSNQLPPIRIRMSASSRDSSNKSLFEQTFGGLKMPWDSDPSSPSTKEHQWQWFKNSSPPTAQTSSQTTSTSADNAAIRTQRKPRVPRYPSTLQIDMMSDTEKSSKQSKEVIDNYVQSAMTAATEMSVNGNNGKQVGGFDDKQDAQIMENSPDKRERKPKLGILLIDHGSKRKASNDHLHSIAKQYQSSLLDDGSNEVIDKNVVVRAAHMDIADPSILTTLRQLVVEEKVTKVVCVPYFLSPGKHATIDVPNLIEDAVKVLEEDGVLDYDGGFVEIISSKALGTNVESMLDVVDSLVETTLGEEGDSDVFPLQKSRNEARNVNETCIQNELRKYMDRVTLLEKILPGKVERLKTMTDRVTILEDVVQTLQSKLKTEQENMLETQLKKKEVIKTQMANLTKTINSLAQERNSLKERINEMSLQQQLVEKCHNATVTKLQESIACLENDIQLRREEADEQNQKIIEKTSKEAEKMNRKVQLQEEKVKHLQKQLTDLLDAYNELEKLQSDTEVVVLDYKDQLKKARDMFDSELTCEKEKKEDYKVKWNELQLQLEGERDKSVQLLVKQEAKYERLLQAEREASNDWKHKWEGLSKELASKSNENTSRADMSEISDTEWVKWKAKREEATLADRNATSVIKELEDKLQQQQKEYESTLSRKETQQAQLQKYLQAELQTYYKTIQNQTAQLDSYKNKLEQMEAKHKESILIATNSVEASQKREVDMLIAIEELENELSTVSKEREEGEKLLQHLQDRLEEHEKKTKQQQSVPLPTRSSDDTSWGASDESKEDLSKVVKQLQNQVQALASEMRTKNVYMEIKDDQSEVTSSRWQRWRYRILRPWKMFDRNV